jgi:predicted ATPase/transcriptional regulator with XRE-family HTH domain
MAGIGTIAEELGRHIQRRGYSLERLARESGVSKATIHRWQTGKVVRPYYWENLLNIANALYLTKVDTDRLLFSSGLPSIDTLSSNANPEQQCLFRRWTVPSRNNLPGNLTSFVGRQVETLEIAGLLSQDDVRLVTLTGPGGAGKTRLSLKVANELHDVFPDGIFFVPLANVTNPLLVVPAIARTLELRDVPGQSTDARLVQYLRNRRVLLVLDNMEHLVDTAHSVVSMLQAAQYLTVLATSRIPLRVSCEHIWPVAQLEVPAFNTTPAALRGSHAVRLFAERANAVNPAFGLTDANVTSVVEICRRLDGSPLAIELAAARCRAFAVDEILERFPNLLDLGSDGPRDLPDRQQSLRAAIDWSYELLSASAQVLFRRLAVFSGGWPSEAIPAVCDGNAESLAELIDSNLVYRLPEKRYGMLETIREYAREQLTASAEDATFDARHAAYYLERTESAGPYIPQSRQEDWLRLIDREYDNIQTALERSSTEQDSDLTVRLAAALWPFWHEYDRFTEGERWLAVARALDDGHASETRAQLLTGSLFLAYSRGEIEIAERYGEQALVLWRELDHPHGIALTLLYMGLIRYVSGDVEAAQRLYEECLRLWRSAGEPLGVARCLSEFALLAGTTGQGDLALEHLREALDIYEREHDHAGIVRSRLDQGMLAMLAGELHIAIPALTEGVSMCRAMGNNHHLGWSLFYLGTSFCFAGEHERASAALEESVRIHQESDSKYGMAYTLLGFAALRHRQGRHCDAARLCGAVTTLLEVTGITMNPVAQQMYLQETMSVKSELGSTGFDRAYASGRDMIADEIVAFALAESN